MKSSTSTILLPISLEARSRQNCIISDSRVLTQVEATRQTYSRTISRRNFSSRAIDAYKRLYAFWIFWAWSKHACGKGLGNNVTGAVVAKTPRGSASAETTDNGGLTVKPWATDQSLIVERSCSDSDGVRFGG
jgi:hypothetical protein